VAGRRAAHHTAASGKPRRNRLTTAVVVLSCALGAALGTSSYFWRTALAWQATSDAWEDQARRQGNDIAILNAQLDGSADRLTAMEDQLGTATNRISTLADEKAQLGDENAIRQYFLEQQQAHLTYQELITSAATSTTDALTSCASSQADLIALLRAAANPTIEPTATDGGIIDPTTNDGEFPRTNTDSQAAEIDLVSTQTDRLCANAMTSVDTLRSVLAENNAAPATGTDSSPDSEFTGTDAWNKVPASLTSNQG